MSSHLAARRQAETPVTDVAAWSFMVLVPLPGVGSSGPASGIPGGKGLEDRDERVPISGADRVEHVREACSGGEDRRWGGERGDGREIEVAREEREQDNGGVRNTVESNASLGVRRHHFLGLALS